MPVFFTERFEKGYAILDQEESRHVIRVLRLGMDDVLEIVDGKGNLYKGRISRADPEGVMVNITEIVKDYLHRPFRLHIGIAPTKSSERFEWFLEKSTEIGIDEITPILCKRSERKHIRMERARKILLSAMKQSGRALTPLLNEPVPFEHYVTGTGGDIKLIAHCGTGPIDATPALPAGSKEWLILIGPEGDFSPEEIRLATKTGFMEMNLGPAVYRTETAGIMACHMINLRYQ